MDKLEVVGWRARCQDWIDGVWDVMRDQPPQGDYCQRQALTPHAPAQAEIDRLRNACAQQNEEVCQVLGKALGYPWFKDHFPDASEADGVCVSDHVAESLADEAAARIKSLEARALAAEAEVSRLTDLNRELEGLLVTQDICLDKIKEQRP
jgi:hypothetical protein